MIQKGQFGKKRRLTEDEIQAAQLWMDSSPLNKKPSIRTIAHRFGVNRPSVIKSLGGWKGIQRGAPQIKKTPRVIDHNMASPIKIEPMTTDIPEELKT